MSISSQTQISKLKSVSSELSNSVTDIRSIKDNLVSSSSDKALSIVGEKLEEIATKLSTISQEVSSYADTVQTATNRVNERLESVQKTSNENKETEKKNGWFSL